MLVMEKEILHTMRRALYGGLNSASEFVTPGHPDKSCDQIAGKILDQALKIDAAAKVAIEMVACNGKIKIGGELGGSVKGKINVHECAKSIFINLGYEPIAFPIEVEDITNFQAEDILIGDGKKGVKRIEEGVIGAGDQGIMCGYAMHAPEREHMPAAFWYSQRLAMKLFEVITNKTVPYLFADGKTQVVINNGKISHVTIAIQHGKEWSGNQNELKTQIEKYVIQPTIGDVESIIVNGTGIFEKGSIWADAGEVGRKIVIDQMGPDIPVGGGTLNGKDPSKVDLTGAVMARYIAKNIVAHGLADEALVQFAFTIGKSDPDQINFHVPGWKLNITPEEWCKKHFELSVAGMIKELSLNNPIGWSFEDAAKFGFYGHTHFPWEKVKDMVGDFMD
jgi:S-adenosylmethionine synthetase